MDDLPIIPTWTSRYPARGQTTLVTACGDPRVGNEMMLSDLKVFVGEASPYRRLRVMPHLDHAFPWLDGDILYQFVDRFASVMFDASEKSFEENLQLTAEYVQKVQGRVVVEGAVGEIFKASGTGAKNEPTTVAGARRFLRDTGVDLLVPNVGTEHRVTTGQVRYRSDRAREISAAVGKVLCLHGTSSLRPEDLPKLPEDGFVKVNIYTTLAVKGGQALARHLLDNLGNIFSENQLRELVEQGVLGAGVLSQDYGQTKWPIKPKLEYVANPTTSRCMVCRGERSVQGIPDRIQLWEVWKMKRSGDQQRDPNGSGGHVTAPILAAPLLTGQSNADHFLLGSCAQGNFEISGNLQQRAAQG